MQMTSLKVTVTGNIGEFKIGQVLTDTESICRYYRTIIGEGEHDPTNVSNSQIIEAIETFPGDDEETEISRIESIESQL